jgi:hypothetical protein
VVVPYPKRSPSSPHRARRQKRRLSLRQGEVNLHYKARPVPLQEQEIFGRYRVEFISYGSSIPQIKDADEGFFLPSF